MSERYIDYFDHGYSWLRHENTQQPETDALALHQKYVRRAFHKFGKHAPAILRFHLIARFHFQRGYFSASEMAQVLSEQYGYSMMNRGSLKRLADTLRDCEWFTAAGDNFRFKSWHRIVGIKKYEKLVFSLPLEYLHKKNRKAFIDILINIAASSESVPTEDITNMTGFKRTRVFEAIAHGPEYGFKKSVIMARIIDEGFVNFNNALQARRSYYHDGGILTEIIQREESGLYYLYVKAGNHFNSLSAESEGADRRKSGNKNAKRTACTRRNGSVYEVIGPVTGIDAMSMTPVSFTEARFKKNEKLRFIDRHFTDK